MYFMKYTYYYVIFLLLPFVTCLHLIYAFGKWRNILVPLTRVITCGVILFIMGWEFNVYGSLIGVCSFSKLNNEELVCEWYGYTWSSFDISGHIFHNVFGMFVIVEEASYYKLWIFIELLVDVYCPNKTLLWTAKRTLCTKVTDEEKAKLTLMYHSLSTILKVNFCILAVLVFMLNIANLLTVIYFHTVIENIVAAVVALTMWILCYRVVFPLYGANPGSVEMHRELQGRMETGDYSIIEAEYLIDVEEKKSYNTV